MPSSVLSASVGSPARVLPHSLCASFAHKRQMAVQQNRYAGGETQVGLLVSEGAPRLSWTLAKRLTATAMETLRDFYADCNGPQMAFYFYDTSERTAVYDSTGAATTGRYTVRFDGGWSESSAVGRGSTSISMVQVA